MPNGANGDGGVTRREAVGGSAAIVLLIIQEARAWWREVAHEGDDVKKFAAWQNILDQTRERNCP